MTKRTIYLTDGQYLAVLKLARERLNKTKKIEAVDSTAIGNKYSETNCGLCNDSLTTGETAIWPDQFPHRKTMKYRKRHHICPLDWRGADLSDPNGCFYTCMIFKKKVKTIKEVKQLYDKLIQGVLCQTKQQE